MKNVTLEIEGMKCEGCASAVVAALKEVAGVRRADVSLEDGVARVVGDVVVDGSELVSAVEDAGYRARMTG